MRLIDADKFKQQIAAITVADNLPAEKCNAMCRLIDKQPTVGDRYIDQEVARAAYNVVRRMCSNQPSCVECILYNHGECMVDDKIPVDWPDLEVPDV